MITASLMPLVKHLKSSLLILVPNTSKCCITVLLNYSPYWHFQVNKLIPSSNVLVLELQVEWRNSKTGLPLEDIRSFIQVSYSFFFMYFYFLYYESATVHFLSLKRLKYIHRHTKWGNLKNKNFNEYKVYCIKTLDPNSLPYD